MSERHPERFRPSLRRKRKKLPSGLAVLVPAIPGRRDGWTTNHEDDFWDGVPEDAPAPDQDPTFEHRILMRAWLLESIALVMRQNQLAGMVLELLLLHGLSPSEAGLKARIGRATVYRIIDQYRPLFFP